MKAEDLKLVVQEKYGAIANQSVMMNHPQSSCCGTSGCCGELEFSMIGDEYKNIKGYNPDADLGLGCGLPTQFADLKIDDHVLDLGSGAGNDCFVARAIVGESGKVTGIDFTDAMLEKAKENAEKLGYRNVEFVKGDIENMPLPDSAFDVVISNCVLNLVPDKAKAFHQIFRVLKQGAHFCISDVVINGKLPDNIQQAAEMYAGCVSGAIAKDDYLRIIENAGFSAIQLKKEKQIVVPDSILLKYLSREELDEFHLSGTGIYSITVTATKK